MDDKNQPKVRFSGFTDPWEQRKFGELWRKTSNKNTNEEFSDDDIISVAQMQMNTSLKISKQSYLKTYNVLQYGEIAFEGNKSKNYSFGRFVLNNLRDGIVSHVFITFKPLVDMNIDFMKEYIHYEPVMKHILVKSTTKTVMMTTLNVNDVSKQKILFPIMKEQIKIGKLLDIVSGLIAANQDKVDQLKKMKKWLMQNMFV
ncbi:restriction endonuclease subunit S [Paucilactobacillus kaifaensis]|uniref:restriction endonuclease subunit S n=1 Tax=Paucilactobacillus kaifaensis TaxID=2559921 RepID=UPI0010F86956|nr:restriction endonuclease subunit S [Paucilactobacillus kaifaensis]